MVPDTSGASCAARSRWNLAFRDVSRRGDVPPDREPETTRGELVSVIVAMPERFGLASVPSIRIECVRCRGAVWLSKRATLRSEDSVICVVCAMAVVKPGDQITPAPWVIVDLAERLAGEE